MSSSFKGPARERAPDPGREAGALPREYGVTRLTILPRDPDWLHAYWEIAAYTWKEVEKTYGPQVRSGRPALRLYIDARPGENGDARSLEVAVQLDARNWYVKIPAGGGRCRAELGVILADGRFAVLAMSNEIWLSSGRVSDRADETWQGLMSEWERMYQLSGAGRLGAGSMDIARALAQHWEFLRAISSWAGGSSGLSSPKRAYGAKGFWLRADCELIVYGATEPDAKLTFQGKALPLNADGTFSVRLALPDGKLEIPIEATNRDGDLSESVEFKVTRRTR